MTEATKPKCKTNLWKEIVSETKILPSTAVNKVYKPAVTSSH